MKPLFSRIASIDVFRALTMLLMVFVNDLWSLVDYPEWLGHTQAHEDGMGLADVVFPLFLFIVGLSIPFAIKNREKKGHSARKISFHILVRSFSLILMGVYMVNLENYNSELAHIHKYWWELLMALAIFLIWNLYPQTNGVKKKLFQVLPGVGVGILLILGILYKGGSSENPVWMQTHWWGILGLIGWAYLISAFIFLASRTNVWIIAIALIFFNLFNLGNFSGWFDPLSGIKRYVWIVGNGSMPAFTIAGVLASVVYMKLNHKARVIRFLSLMALLGVIMLVFGFATRPAWGISKIQATPAWVGICTGIGFLMFGLLFILIDLLKKNSWFKIIKPAGTSTLTCYLIPYWIYPIVALVGIQLPVFFRSGIVGIIKSLLFALMVVLITGLLERFRIKLKI